MMHVKLLRMLDGSVETADLRVKGQIGVHEFLWETRVARLAKCRLEQKAGYGQHTSRPDHNGAKATSIFL